MKTLSSSFVALVFTFLFLSGQGFSFHQPTSIPRRTWPSLSNTALPLLKRQMFSDPSLLLSLSLPNSIKFINRNDIKNNTQQRERERRHRRLISFSRICFKRWFLTTLLSLTLWLGLGSSSFMGNHATAAAATATKTTASTLTSSISSKLWTRSSFAAAQPQHPTPPESSSLSSSVRFWTAGSVVLGTAAMGVAKTMQKQQSQEQKNPQEEDQRDQEEQLKLVSANKTAHSSMLPEAMAVSSVGVSGSSSKSSSSLKAGKILVTTADAADDVATESSATTTATAVLVAPTFTKTHSSPQTTHHHHPHHQPYHVLPPYYSDVTKARKQPKSRWTEAKLQERYAAIQSLEERTFQILVDLGMVEIHPPLTQEEEMLIMKQQSTTTTTTSKDTAPELEHNRAWQ